MKKLRFCSPLLMLLGALVSSLSVAGIVTMEVKTTSGSPVEDTVIIFDPLDTTEAPTHDLAIIDQINKRFVPRVSVVRTGTSVAFPNRDQIRHQVYSFSDPKAFTLKLYAGSPKAAVVFDKPGLVVLGCNIHDTMVAFVAVVDSPYFVKVPPSGTSALDLPAGRYRVRIWHPSLATPLPPKEISVSSAPLMLPIIVDLDTARDVVASLP
ncbi:MAG TPA: methylamine utilization protein [Steroidobacteraceae bacterium]